MNSSVFNETTVQCEISTTYWIFQIIVYPTLLILYCIVVYILCKYRTTDFKNSYFTLILALAFGDMISFVMFTYDFFDCYYQNNFEGVLAAVVDALYYSFGWWNIIFLNIAVSLNRFTAIVYFSRYRQVWTEPRTKLVVALCVILSLIPATSHMLIVYGFPAYVYVEKMTDIVFSCGITVIILLAIYFPSAVLSVVRMKKLVGVKVKYNREIKMLIQGIFIVTMLIIVDISYWLDIERETNDMLFLLSSGLNPIIYLALDSRLRRKFLLTIHIVKNDDKTIEVSTVDNNVHVVTQA